MRRKRKNIGIVGCGAIGSALAKTIGARYSRYAEVSALCDIERPKAEKLSGTLRSHPSICSLEELITLSDVIVEAASASVAPEVARKSLAQGKDVLIMSVGGLLQSQNGRRDSINSRTGGRIHVPSGAVGGLDALRAVRGERIDRAVLRTFKPPQALAGIPFLKARGIEVERLKKRKKIFEGSVPVAVRRFPQNINVAAAVALALNGSRRLTVEIYCDPALKRNIHEVEAEGSFGRIAFIAENIPSEQNPKTSKLAILSAVSTLENIILPAGITV